jgi:hypothetical protein
MGGSSDDKSFPYFEGKFFRDGSNEIIETAIPKDFDANGNPIVMNVRERAEFDRKLKEYKDKDKIAYPNIMQACLLLNPVLHLSLLFSVIIVRKTVTR